MLIYLGEEGKTIQDSYRVPFVICNFGFKAPKPWDSGFLSYLSQQSSNPQKWKWSVYLQLREMLCLSAFGVIHEVIG